MKEHIIGCFRSCILLIQRVVACLNVYLILLSVEVHLVLRKTVEINNCGNRKQRWTIYRLSTCWLLFWQVSIFLSFFDYYTILSFLKKRKQNKLCCPCIFRRPIVTSQPDDRLSRNLISVLRYCTVSYNNMENVRMWEAGTTLVHFYYGPEIIYSNGCWKNTQCLLSWNLCRM
jgi:hypothetical protein